jgi:hypothetical protein
VARHGFASVRACSAPQPGDTAEETAAPSRGIAVAAIAVVIVSGFLIFFRLDQRLLWQDEAETALLARNILIYGVPKAYDGKNLVSQEVGREYHADYVWRWTPWLEKYVTAASFGLLGESTYTARLPFAVIGLLSVISIYPLAVVLFRDRWVGVLAMAFLALSVPFLLHVRQCRYYSLAIVASIWVLYFFVGLARRSRGAVAGFTVAMSVLFHSNYLMFIATAIALAPCALWLGFDRSALRRGAVAAGLILLLNGPWALYFDLFGKTTEKQVAPFLSNLIFYLALANRYTFPGAALLIFVALAWLLRRDQLLLNSRTWRPFLALVAIPAIYLIAVSTAPWSFYRYTVNLLPLAAVLLAFMCHRLLRWNRIVGGLFIACALLTGVLSQLSGAPFSYSLYTLPSEGRSFPICDTFFPLGNYLYEVTHSYFGPMEELLLHLRQAVRPGDRVFISYGDLVLQFYTHLEVRGGQSGRELTGWPDPQWIIVRSFFRFADRPVLRADAERTWNWLRTGVRTSDYQKLPATRTDFPWDDIPEPQLHWFREPEGGRTMQVYRRKELGP